MLVSNLQIRYLVIWIFLSISGVAMPKYLLVEVKNELMHQNSDELKSLEKMVEGLNGNTMETKEKGLRKGLSNHSNMYIVFQTKAIRTIKYTDATNHIINLTVNGSRY